MHKAVDWLCKYYESDVIGFYAAQFPTIVANTTKTAKELLNNKDLDGKPQLALAKIRDPDCVVRGNVLIKKNVYLLSQICYIRYITLTYFTGLFFTEGQLWHEQRRFTLRNLRDFGFGRRHVELELELNDEIKNLIDLIKNGPEFHHEKVVYFQYNLLVVERKPYTLNQLVVNF